MFRKIFFPTLALLLMQACTGDQTKNIYAESTPVQKLSNSGDTTAIKNGDDETSELLFSQEWVWEYRDEDGKNQTMSVYWHPELNYWLFEKNSSAYTDDMTDWFILKPDGVLWSAYKDPELDSKKKILRSKWEKGFVAQDLPDNWMPTGKTAEFGRADMGFKPYEAVEFEVTHPGASAKSIYYLAESEIDMTPIYAFNELFMDAMLPVGFPNNIPGNKIILSGKPIQSPGGFNPEFKFRFRSHAEYYIHPADYEFEEDTPYYTLLHKK